MINKPSKQELYKFYVQKKLSLIDIGRIFDCSHVTVKRWLMGYNIPIRGSGIIPGTITSRRILPLKEELVKLHKNNSYSAIGRMYGVSRQAVHQIITKS